MLEAKDCLELCSILAKIFSYTKTSIRKDEQNILGKYGNTFWKSEDQEFKLLPPMINYNFYNFYNRLKDFEIIFIPLLEILLFFKFKHIFSTRII